MLFLTIGGFISTLVMAICATYLLKLSKKKLQKTVSPDIANPWDKTYCSLSVWIIRSTQVCLVATIICHSTFLFAFGLGPKFYIFFFPETEQNNFEYNSYGFW